ncbi:MAG: right-handed parallel beta-helix repeat-containing protein, partial [Clostridia bacterium]|nr:right-handed parallel beta-helix repeat-containing protein [Clostridia bacterium]
SAQAMEQLGEGESLCVWIGTKLCIVGSDEFGIQEALYRFMEENLGYVREGASLYLTLTDFVTVTDGSEDVTKGFEKAVSEAKKTGKPIFVPMGEYQISGTVRLDALTVVGEVRNGQMPLIRHTATEKSLFTLNNGGMVSNLTIDSAADAACPEIEMLSPGCQVKNVLIRNPYVGICAGSLTKRSVNPGRLVIENVTVVSPSYAGIYVCGSRDTSWIRDCAVYADGKTVPCAFWLTDNDQIITSGLRSYGAEIGFHIDCVASDASGSYGGYWGTFTDCTAIGGSVGMRIGQGTHKCTLTGCTFRNVDTALWISDATGSETVVSASGCELRSEADATVVSDGARILNLSYSRVIQAGSESPAVLLRGGTMTGISNNEILAKGTPVVIDTDEEEYACSIVTNDIRTESADAVRNTRESDSRQILDNVIASGSPVSIDSVSYETKVEHISSVSDVSASVLGHNVMEFGAAGDGSHDDTQAFLSAISEAEKDRLPVLVPQGNYRISSTLTLD